MSSPAIPLFTRSLKGWFSAKGFWLVVAASLFPLVLTGAWVGTHRADVSASGLHWDATHITEGQVVHFTATIKNSGTVAVDGSNATLAVGTVVCTQTATDPATGAPRCIATRFSPEGSQDIVIDHLAPGESKELALDWNATAGLRIVLAEADVSDIIGEIDEFNNQNVTAIEVGYQMPANDSKPTTFPVNGGSVDESNLTGTANASVHADLAVVSISTGGDHIASGESTTFTAEFTNLGPDAIHNATAHLQFSNGFPATSQGLDLAPGETKNVTLQYIPQEGAYWLQAFIETPSDATDANAANNHDAKAFTADPKLPADFQFPVPPEKQTIKEFYNVVLALYLRLVLPLVALFYAAGIISEERNRGSLAYILTKPTPRWVFPITKFVASFLVAVVATVVGVTLTFALLFGTSPQTKEIGYFTSPLLASLLSLFAYGAFFTLLGVYIERPFLAGIAFIAWEFFDVPWLGFGQIVNQVALVPQMKNVSIAYHVTNALNAWPVDQGVLWLPVGDGGTRALLVALGIGVASLVGAAYVMKRKEFDL